MRFICLKISKFYTEYNKSSLNDVPVLALLFSVYHLQV